MNTSNAVVVTGASSGIGLAIARRQLESGRQVVGLSRHMQRVAGDLCDLAEKCGAPPPLCLDADVADAAQLGRAALMTKDAGIGVRSVLAAAGVNFREPALELAPDRIARMLDVNVTGVLATFRAFAEQAFASDAPRFIAIGSVAGSFGMQLRVMYSATKAALEAMARGLAIEWARFGATVNVVAPGIVDTPLTRGYLDKNPGLEDRVKAATLAGRLGLPEDVSAAVEYFDSRSAAFTTGQTLVVDGGFSVGNTWW
ncbi:MAG: SDR family oxidoreductase [Bifidobacteriaceae bacterium]|jgi:NAD(P)-dependent dehydrogenase (short-subunit alcohol dehydrogenase family)|nr:SDR family oxidoreductase [Bifidobacteriaceae bacterium]